VKSGKSEVFLKRTVLEDLGESAGVNEDRQMSEGIREEEAAKDQMAMANAEDAAQKAAQQSAVRQAQLLHDQDVTLENEVREAAQEKDAELAKEDAELEKSAKETDKMAADIMGPKADKAERREEKVLLGEDTSNFDDDDHDELEFGTKFASEIH